MEGQEIKKESVDKPEKLTRQTLSMEPIEVVEVAQEELVLLQRLDVEENFSLEDIMKEFGSGAMDEPEQEKEPEQPQEAPQPAEPEVPVSGDTIRLDTAVVAKSAKKVKGAAPISEEEDAKEVKEPFSDQWEPEYEQPMGEYIPPQPILIHPRSKIRELKRKLVAGPEKIYHTLSKKGLGKLQASIFLSFLVALISAGSTVMYAMGMVQEDRMKLMVFGQFFAMWLSALLGCQRLIDGVADLFKKRFTLNTLLVVTFILCCADGVLCLMQLRVPCCAAFSLEMTMALWSAYHRRSTQMAQMDTLRKAIHLEGVYVSSNYYTNKKKIRKGLLRAEAELEEFMDHYERPSVPEKILCWYAFVAMLAGLGVGVGAYMLQGDISTSVSMAAVSLLAATPVTIFITLTRPMAILQRRLRSVGTVLCGWQGVKALRGKSVFPVEYSDLFPVGSARMNGVKFFGSRPTDEVVAYCTSVIVANGSGLAPLFTQVLDSRNGYHYDCQELCSYEGGIGGVVEGESVLVGPISFLKEMGVEVPAGMRVNQAICVAIEGELCGLFALTYENARTAAVGLAALCSGRGSNPVIATDDFLLTQNFIRSRFGIKPRKFRFPDSQMRAELLQKKPDEGKPAAMLVTRDGLVSYAYGITGAKALRSASSLGLAVHVLGGLLGLGVMALLLIMGRLDLLTPANMFLYQIVWMIPGLLITEWCRTV